MTIASLDFSQLLNLPKIDLTKYKDILPLLISFLPEHVVIKGKLVDLKATIAKAVADLDLDAEDAILFIAAYQGGKPVPLPPVVTPLPPVTPVPPPPVVILPPRPAPGEPGTVGKLIPTSLHMVCIAAWDRRGEPVPFAQVDGKLVPTGGTSSFDDRTKFRFEAGVEGRINPQDLAEPEKGMHYDDYPYLKGAVEFIATSPEGQLKGSIGGTGTTTNPPRRESGAGWSADLYFVSKGANCTVNLKEKLQGGFELSAILHDPTGKGYKIISSNVVETAPVR